MLSREYFKIIQLESRFNKSGLFVCLSVSQVERLYCAEIRLISISKIESLCHIERRPAYFTSWKIFRKNKTRFDQDLKICGRQPLKDI